MAYPKVKVKDLKNGSIVRFEGEWGVIEGRYLDRWMAGSILMERDEVVELLVELKKKRK